MTNEEIAEQATFIEMELDMVDAADVIRICAEVINRKVPKITFGNVSVRYNYYCRPAEVPDA